MNIVTKELASLYKYIEGNTAKYEVIANDPIAFRLAEHALCSQQGIDYTASPSIIPDHEEWYIGVETLVRDTITAVRLSSTKARRGTKQLTGKEIHCQNFDELYITTEATLRTITVEFDIHRAFPIPPCFVHIPEDDEMLQAAQQVYGTYFFLTPERVRNTKSSKLPRIIRVTLRWIMTSDVMDGQTVMYAYNRL